MYRAWEEDGVCRRGDMIKEIMKGDGRLNLLLMFQWVDSRR